MEVYKNPYAAILKTMRAQGAAQSAADNKSAAVVGTLTSISPIAVTALGMELQAEDIRVNDDLITNEYVKFRPEDVGKSVLLIVGADAQTFFLVCKIA